MQQILFPEENSITVQLKFSDDSFHCKKIFSRFAIKTFFLLSNQLK